MAGFFGKVFKGDKDKEEGTVDTRTRQPAPPEPQDVLAMQRASRTADRTRMPPPPPPRDSDGQIREVSNTTMHQEGAASTTLATPTLDQQDGTPGIQQLMDAAIELREVEAEVSSKLMTIALRLEETLGSGATGIFLEPASMIIETSEEVRNLERLLLTKDIEIQELSLQTQELMRIRDEMGSQQAPSIGQGLDASDVQTTANALLMLTEQVSRLESEKRDLQDEVSTSQEALSDWSERMGLLAQIVASDPRRRIVGSLKASGEMLPVQLAFVLGWPLDIVRKLVDSIVSLGLAMRDPYSGRIRATPLASELNW